MKKIGTAARGSSVTKAQNVAGKAMSTRPVDLKLFKAAVASKLRETGVIAEDAEYENHPALLEVIELFEIALGKAVNEYGNAVEASAAFNDWLDVYPYEYTEPILFRIDDFTITVTVQTKSGTLSVGATVTPLIDDHAQAVIAAKDMLQKIFNGAFSNGVSRTLPETTNTEGKKTYKTNQDKVGLLRVGQYNSKTVYHCIPIEGNWTQFGIPLYPDVAKSEGIDLPTKDGEYEVDWKIVYELKDDGKPRRVISILDV